MAILVTPLRPILAVAEEIGLAPSELDTYGPHKAKVALEALERRRGGPDGDVILVTAVTPTPAGEGKTVTAIGLAQALRAAGERAVVCLREPSMGPVFGLKGGATGGGRCTVEPAGDINLHFTGDLHAVTAATNLLAALLDDHLYRGREPRIDVRRPTVHRVLDVNDRALRRVVIGLGGVPREDQFEITAASEVMAILGLARDVADLRGRLGRIVAGWSPGGLPVTAEDLHGAGAMAALLGEALRPNLVQTREGGAAFVHAGPFANIAHGTSSLISLLLGRKLADYVVIEAGFGADLGAEKFINLVGAHGGPHPRVAVVVATIRALKYHAGVPPDRLTAPSSGAVVNGLPQLRHHVEIVRRLRMQPVICVNVFETDAPAELSAVAEAARAWGVPAARSVAFARGGEGAAELAAIIRDLCGVPALEQPRREWPGPLYRLDAPLEEKLLAIAREIYGASGVTYSDAARRRREEFEASGYGRLPVCVAKTQYSLTDDPDVRGVPTGFTIHIRDMEVRAGAGFIVALAGEMVTMPALPPRPRAWEIDLNPDGTVRGVA